MGFHHVRAAVSEDVAALHALALAFTPNLTSQVERKEFLRRARQRIAAEDWYIAVAEHDDTLIGYAAAQDYGRGLRAPFGVGRLHDLYVDPEHRHGGAGRGLMQAMFSWARTRPYELILDWQAPADAVSFYERMGLTADWRGDHPEHPGFSLDTRNE